ncbi:apolipoprotein N-acyltransferase [Desulfobacterales bacterium HSG16]|nr:apolipoprotein N-acyltransferase [Desulfobacterales bacterium HSG16]
MAIKRIILAAVSGLLMTAAFPKVGMDWLIWVAIVPVLAAVSNSSRISAFALGFICGLVHHLTLEYWVVNTMRTFGGLHFFPAILILILFASYLGIYVGIFSYILSSLCKTPVKCLVISPFLWVALEYVRSFLFTGFPWEFVGCSQFKHLYLIQISNISGVYGLSFIIIFSNAVLFFLYQHLRKKKWHGELVSRTVVVRAGVVLVCLLAGNLLYGKWSVNCTDREIDGAQKKRVSVIQGNIAQNEKWSSDARNKITEKYIRLSEQAGKDATDLPSNFPPDSPPDSPLDSLPDMIVWPEAAMPFVFQLHQGPTKQVKQMVRKMKTFLLAGGPYVEKNGEDIAYYNSAWLIGPDGDVKGRYDKSHLVPFGEYVPLRQWLPFVGKIIEQIGDMSPGRDIKPLHTGERQTDPITGPLVIGPLVCYEGIFSDLSGKMASRGAQFLVNITNDAWYGTSSAPYQLFSMSVFRAVETKRSLVRAANTGISGFIDPAGRITGSTKLFENAVMTRDIPILNTKTLYAAWGDVFGIACTFFTFAGLIFLMTWRRKQNVN